MPSVLKTTNLNVLKKMTKSIFYTTIIILALFISCSKNNLQPKEPETKASTHKKVLLIGIDGCVPTALTKADTPNLDALMNNGTFSLDARNPKTTMSGPGWSSILSGVWEEKHGVTNNSFKGANFKAYPHFFKYVKKAYPNSRTVSISEWNPINEKIANEYSDVLKSSLNAAETRERAIAELGVDNLTSMFLQFDGPDKTGHSSGFSAENEKYIKSIEEVDAAIGGIIEAMKNRKNYAKEDWLVIVTTDHGGIGTSHGGNSEEERTVFMIVSGNNVPKQEIKKTTQQSTIPPAQNCLNSNYELAFKRNGIVSIPTNSIYNFGDSKDFSIECRFRATDPADVSIVSKKDWKSGLRPGFVFSFKPNTKKFKVNIGDGSNRVDIETSIITDNKWHTVSATFDRDGFLKVYVDGVLEGSASLASIGNINNNFPVTFGADGNNAYKFDGFIAEVRIFDTILSKNDIDTWKCRELDNSHAKYDNLQGYWKINEGTGTKINDHSKNKKHGTLAGATWNNAKADQIVAVHDYTKTPRIVDGVTSALDHLCIDIESIWGLDGNSLVSKDCNE